MAFHVFWSDYAVCVQKARTADGFNTCERLTRACECLHVKARGRETDTECQDAFRGIQAYDHVPSSEAVEGHLLPCSTPTTSMYPRHIPNVPWLGRHTVFVIVQPS